MRSNMYCVSDMRFLNIVIHRTKIHTFSYTSLTTKSSKQTNQPPVAITALVQSPAIDVVGIGFASGEISVYDVRADERLMRMAMQDGAVRSLSFRSGMYCVPCTIDIADTHTLRQMDNPSWHRHRRTGTSRYGTSILAANYCISCAEPMTVLSPP